MPFDDLGLADPLLRAVRDAGFEEPTPIQRQAIPLALSGRDVIGLAQTGSGKTAAFLLPLLQRLLPGPRGRTRALVLTPTRELALQTDPFLKMFVRHTPLRGAAVFGGVGMVPQERALRDGVDVVTATPGRLIDPMERGNPGSTASRSWWRTRPTGCWTWGSSPTSGASCPASPGSGRPSSSPPPCPTRFSTSPARF